MNAIDLVQDDHARFRKLLDELDKTTEKGIKTREQGFARLKREVVSHEQMEEQIFYPALREARRKAEDIVLEGIEEHHVANLIVEELSSLPADDEAWGAKMSVLKESIEHHMKEEEGEMFAHARKAFTSAELEELGKQMAEVKKTVFESLTP
jgi:iron-sulfur cluster repair protein YtfE (RIC family)